MNISRATNEQSLYKKGVLVILPSLSVGGMEINRIRLVTGLLQRDWPVRVLVLAKSPGARLEVPSAVSIEYLDIRRFRWLPIVILRKYGNLEGYIVLVGMWPLTFIFSQLRLIGLLRCNLIVSEHISINAMFANYKHIRRLFFDLSLFISILGANRFVFLTQPLYQEFYERFPKIFSFFGLSCKVRIIRNPFIPSNVLDSSTIMDYESLWKVNSKGKRFVSIGRLKAQKNHQLLIRSFAALSDPEAELLIAGEDGGCLADLKALILKLGCTERVRLVGYCKSPAGFLATADVFVLSSDYEGSANVVIEAMMAGLKIFSTDCPGGPREFLEKYPGLSLFEVNDSNELTRLLSEYLTNEVNERYVFSVPAGSTYTAYVDSYERLLFELSGRNQRASEK